MEPKICIIGAGFSGLNAAIQLKKQLGLTNFVIFDENEDLGGTWLVNKYPGCACDVQSHLYSYSFEQNPNWSLTYSAQEEIWRYLQSVGKKYDLYSYIKFHHQVTKMAWDDKNCKWKLVIKDKRHQVENEMDFDIIISGIGGLRVPHIPEEFRSFQGKWIHSAEWDTTTKLEGKTVAVVGSGASAVQIIPSIAKKVKKLIVYQRHPAWILPRMQFKIPEWMQWSLTSVPGLLDLYRKMLFWSNEINFPAFIQGSLFQRLGTLFGNMYLKRELGENPELMEKLRPNYELGCKRITPSNEYYPAFKLPHVEVIRSKIEKVKEHSIVTQDGQEQAIDLLILATGYKVQDFYSPLQITVNGDMDLMKIWKEEGPSAYLGICTSVAPNFFMILGPNTGLGHNSIIFPLECQTNYIIQVIKEMMERRAKVVSVKQFIEKGYMHQMLQDLKPTVWATDCGSWYADHRGVITALSPYSLVTYWLKTRRMDPDHFTFY